MIVPYEAKKDFPITPDYTVPKGAMVIPTLWHSLHDETVYPDPYKFTPERWTPDGLAEQNPKYTDPQIQLIVETGSSLEQARTSVSAKTTPSCI